jgi:hypothetical protein
VLFPFFPRYRFSNPQTEQNVFVTRWSYLWAGVFGFFYVLFKGMAQRALVAVFVNATIVVMFIGLTGVTSFILPPRQQFMVIAGAIPVLIAIQGTMMVNIVRDGYKKRGWRIRANE